MVTPYLQEQPNKVDTSILIDMCVSDFYFYFINLSIFQMVIEKDNSLTNIQLKRKKSNKAIKKIVRSFKLHNMFFHSFVC